MGEIREKVRLTNAVDEALARRGELALEKVRRVEVTAVVDTGAVTVLEKLDLLADCTGRQLVPHPGRPNQPVVMVR